MQKPEYNVVNDLSTLFGKVPCINLPFKDKINWSFDFMPILQGAVMLLKDLCLALNYHVYKASTIDDYSNIMSRGVRTDHVANR